MLSCLEALIRQPSIRKRLATLASVSDLPDIWIARIGALSLLHDFGKVNAGFQARAVRGAVRIGHIDEAATVLARHDLSEALGLGEMVAWGAALNKALYVILAHAQKRGEVRRAGNPNSSKT